MTNETRTLIEMSDIKGIEIECPECHLTILYPVAKLFKIAPNCPHCNYEWFNHHVGQSGMAYPAIQSLQELTSQLRTLTRNDRTDIHAKVRIQINIDDLEK